MYESCGGNIPEGSSHGNGFELIKEYFQQRFCRHCNCNYAADGIELIREEPGMVVVRVGCSNCGQPLGIALVGMSGGTNANPTRQANGKVGKSLPPIEEDMPYPADWTKFDIQRLASKAKIGYDDVLDAHEFFAELGSDWQKHLPRKTKKSAKAISA